MKRRDFIALIGGAETFPCGLSLAAKIVSRTHQFRLQGSCRQETLTGISSFHIPEVIQR
jgi:hypothetical protein